VKLVSLNVAILRCLRPSVNMTFQITASLYGVIHHRGEPTSTLFRRAERHNEVFVIPDHGAPKKEPRELVRHVSAMIADSGSRLSRVLTLLR